MGLSDHPGLSRVPPRRAEHAGRRDAVVTLWLVVLAAACALASPATAPGAEVRVDPFNPGGLVVEDSAAEANQMTVSAEPGELVFVDSGAALTTTGPVPCEPVPAGDELRCDSAGIVSLTANVGDGDDAFNLADSAAAAIPNVSISGGPGDDLLIAGAGRQVIVGGSGSDGLDAGAGDDLLDGGDGDDDVRGGAGQDQVLGGTGNDVLDGGDGDDDVRGGPGADQVAGGDGADRLEAPDPATLNADATAAQGPDTVLGGPGDDTLGGGPEADARDADAFSGGAGLDTMSYALRAAGVTVVLDGSAGDGAQGEGDNVQPDVESLVGGAGDDTLVGSDNAELLNGGLGKDTLDGRGGADFLEAGVNDPGNDSLLGGDGADTLRGRAGHDFLKGGPGDDDLSAEGGTDVAEGEGGNDTVEGGTGDDLLDGGDGDDTVYGGDRLLFGADGNNEIDGGPGADRLFGGPASDVVRARDGGRDIVSCDRSEDLAVVDASETSIDNCETVDRPRRRPMLGRTAVVKRGEYKLRLPGGRRFFHVTFKGKGTIPFGSTIKPLRRGIGLATATTKRGSPRSSSLSGGAFTPRQRRATGAATVFRLAGGSFAACPPGLRAVAAARPIRQLRVQARHRHRKRRAPVKVRGRYSIGGSYGTTWLTEERCDGTLTRVIEGTVHVRDLAQDRTVVLHAGEHYLARR
jgi:Ca2+-binding RTX toxin-like protein